MKRLCVSLLIAVMAVGDVYAQIRLRTVSNLQITTPSPLTTFPEDQAIPTQTLTAIGGSGSYTDWAVTSGALPTGISLGAANGQLTGTPTTAGNYSFTIRVTDSAAATAFKAFTWEIEATGTLPAGWTCSDIGAVTVAGSCSESAGTWSLTSATPTLTFGQSDRYTTAYNDDSGNRYIMARVTALTTSGPFGEEGGLRVSQSLAPNSKYASCQFGTTHPQAEWRVTDGAVTSSDTGSAMATGWLRMQVLNGMPNCSYSSDGLSWTSIGMPTAPTMTGTYYFQLVVDGNDLGATSATITDVTIGDFEPPSGGPDFLGYRPHYQGFGADTLGGRTGGTRVCRITTLTISGTATWGATGDLRDCLQGLPSGCTAYIGSQANCARFVICDVSGYTTAGPTNSSGTANRITITGPYLTVALQTCPMDGEGSVSANDGSPGGLTVTDTQIDIDAHDVVIQHLRMAYADWRPCMANCTIGDYLLQVGQTANDLSNGSAHVYNVVIDHCTLMWNVANTGMIGVGGGVRNVQFLDCFFGEPIYWLGPDGSYTAQFARYVDGIVWFRNLSVSAWGRNPTIGLGGNFYTTSGGLPVFCCAPEPWIQRAALSNNVIHNPTDNSDWAGGRVYAYMSWLYAVLESPDGETGPNDMVATENIFQAGPDSGSPAGALNVAAHSNTVGNVSLFMRGNSDNWGDVTANGDQWVGFNSATQTEFHLNAVTSGTGSNIKVTSAPSWWTSYNFQTFPNAQTKAKVIANAGAYPVYRDTEVTRMANDAVNGTGTWHIDPDEVTLPTLATRTRTCSPPSSPNTVYDVESGRTRIEVWLEGIDDLDGTANCDAQRVEVTQGVE